MRTHTLISFAALMSAVATRAELPTDFQPAPLPVAVASFGAASLDGFIYVFGGFKGERHSYCAEEVLGSFHRLKLSPGGSWEALPSLPPSQGASLVAHRNSLYCIAGMAARNSAGEKADLHSKDSVHRFDPATGRWSPMPTLPGPRSSHDSAVVGDRLYVAGGWRLGGATSKAEWHETVAILDLTHPGAGWKEQPQPFRRRALALASVGTRLYCLGGMDHEGSTSLSVDILDTATGTWSKGPDLPPGAMKGFGASAVSVDGRLYCSGLEGDLFRLSGDGKSWETVAHLKQPRFFHRLVPALPGHLAALGGEEREGKLSTVELLSISPNPPALQGTERASR